MEVNTILGAFLPFLHATAKKFCLCGELQKQSSTSKRTSTETIGVVKGWGTGLGTEAMASPNFFNPIKENK